MGSMHQYETIIDRIPGKGTLISVQWPLTTVRVTKEDGGERTVAYVAQLWALLIFNPSLRPFYRVCKVRRNTNEILVPRSGGLPRRNLKHGPATTDEIDVWNAGWSRMSRTRWPLRPRASHFQQRYDYTHFGDSSATTSFDVREFQKLLAGVRDTGEGRPLLDWLVEESSEIAPLLTGPGWLPATIKEFRMVDIQRKADYERKVWAMKKVEDVFELEQGEPT